MFRRLNISIFSLLFVLASTNAMAGETSGWESGRSTSAPTMRDLIPKLSSAEEYSDRYTFEAELDGGGSVYIDFTVTNIGWGDHHGASTVVLKLPGQPVYKYAEKRSRKDWTHDKKSFALNIADSKVSGVGNDGFSIKHEGPVKFELMFKNRLPMWRPGGGAVKFEDQFFSTILISPRADVTGRVFVDGVWKKIVSTGNASADYNASTFAPYDLARRFSRFWAVKGEVFVAWRDIQLTDKKGGRSLTWLVVGYKNQIVFSDPQARMRTANTYLDSKSGYRVPKSVQIDARSGKDKVSLVLRGGKVKRTFMLEDYGLAIQMVAAAVSKPYQFNIDSDFQLQMTLSGATATISGKSPYGMDYMNP